MSAPTTVPTAPAAVPAQVPIEALVPGRPRVPQVNLLPPEIRAFRSLARLKRLLLLLLVLAAAVAALGFVWSTWQVSSAQAELERQEAETSRLLAAQKEYAEVPRVLGALDATKEARTLGTTTEVLWTEYLTQLVVTAPQGVSFESIMVNGATPMTPAEIPNDPLRDVSPATLSFTGRSPVVPDSAAWIETLESIPSFTDAYVTSMAINEDDEDGVKSTYYAVTGSVQITDEAFALRYAEQAEQEDD